MIVKLIQFAFLSLLAFLCYYSVVNVACDPDSTVTCPLDHPLAISAAEYLDTNIKPHMDNGFEAVADFYEEKALPGWNDHAVPFWENNALPAWESAIDNVKVIWASKVVLNWDKYAAPHWEKHVSENWGKFAAPHWDKYVSGKTSEALGQFGENWPEWREKGDSFVREKWHSLSVSLVHDIVPYSYHAIVSALEKSVTIFGIAWEKASPFVDQGYVYLEKAVENVGKTEAFIKVRESAFGKGVEEVYGIWMSGVRFLVDSVNCSVGREDDSAVCDKVSLVFSDMGSYVTGKKE
jgi:hypothetical protein